MSGFYDYWNTYNAQSDFGSLMPSLDEAQSISGVSTFGGNVSSAGYDPLFLFQKYGDRLRLLPKDLYDAVFEAMRGGTTNQFLMQYISEYSGGATLNATWVGEAKMYLPDLE